MCIVGTMNDKVAKFIRAGATLRTNWSRSERELLKIT